MPSSLSKPGVLILAVIAFSLAVPENVHAHRLEAEYRILAGHIIQIESWFDLTGQSPRGATVQIYGSDHHLLTEGKLDADGLFRFPFTRAEPLHVVIRAGAGHRKDLDITQIELERALANGAAQSGTAGESFGGVSVDGPRADRTPRTSIKDLLLGVALLLALAAFVLSVRNGRRLREMR
jgi:hypothetical protein